MPISSTFRTSLNRGFTLVELIVTVSIMILITGIVLTNQSNYSDSTLLDNSASTLGLDVRQAQVYGVSVKEFTPGSNEFNIGYGLSFSLLSTDARKSYISFADRSTGGTVYNGDGVYNGDETCTTGGVAECIGKTALPTGFTISQLCEISENDSTDCTVGRVDVTFVRPETDAYFAFFDDAGLEMFPSSVKGAKVVVSAPNGKSKSVIIYTTGQVSVQ